MKWLDKKKILTVMVLAFFLSIEAFSLNAWSQEDNVTAATSSLQGVLSTLKQSVDQLTVDNDQLASRDKTIKAQILQLQMELGAAQAQGEALNDSAAKLQVNIPRRTRQIEALAEENYSLDDAIDRARAGIKAVQLSLDADYQEDQQLLLKLKATPVLAAPAPVPSPESRAMEHRQVEKLKLMKMIYESEQRQESLQRSILDYQTNTPLGPAAAAMAHQQMLKKQIKTLQDQIALYPPLIPASENQIDKGQVEILEQDLKVLQRNYLQLKEVLGEMTQKARDVRLTVAQHVEEVKLQGTIDGLKVQGLALRSKLDDLRSEMVDLDKRKTRLEELTRHLQ